MFKIYQVKHVRFNNLWVDIPLVLIVKHGIKKIYSNDEIYEINEGEMVVLPNNFDFHSENIPNQNGIYEACCLNVEAEHFLNANAHFNISNQNKPVPIKVRNGIEEISSAFFYFSNAENVPQEILQLRKQELVFWLAKNNYFLPINKDYSLKSSLTKIILNDISYEWNLELVAKKMGIGVSNLRRKLADEGTGFQKILNEIRMLRALELIQTTNKSVTNISYCVGYSSVSRFSQGFKKRFGILPKTLSLHEKNIIKG